MTRPQFRTQLRSLGGVTVSLKTLETLVKRVYESAHTTKALDASDQHGTPKHGVAKDGDYVVEYIDGEYGLHRKGTYLGSVEDGKWLPASFYDRELTQWDHNAIEAFKTVMADQGKLNVPVRPAVKVDTFESPIPEAVTNQVTVEPGRVYHLLLDDAGVNYLRAVFLMAEHVLPAFAKNHPTSAQRFQGFINEVRSCLDNPVDVSSAPKSSH
jgi:hypothetical protein